MSSPILVKIHDDIYDLTNYDVNHPGGKQVIEGFHLRDATVYFEIHHRRDLHVFRMLKFFKCKDAKLVEDTKAKIPPMAKIDKDILEMNRKHGHTTMTWLEVAIFILKPLGISLLGAWLALSCPDDWYWTASALITFSANEGLGMGHEFHHHVVFSTGQLNRVVGNWTVILICGFHGGVVWREHGCHHAHSNIADADSALNVPVIRWRTKQTTRPVGESGDMVSEINRAVLIFLGCCASAPVGWLAGFGHLPIFPWFAEIKDDRMITKNTMAAMVIRLILTTCFLGPMFSIVAPCLGIGIGAFSASINHFDMPMVLLDEFRKQKWTFMRMTLESLHNTEEPHLGDGWLQEQVSSWLIGFNMEHIYHHLLPTVSHLLLVGVEEDVDKMLAGYSLKLKQRNILDASRDAYNVFYNMPVGKGFDGVGVEGSVTADAEHCGYEVIPARPEQDKDKLLTVLRARKEDFFRKLS